MLIHTRETYILFEHGYILIHAGETYILFLAWTHAYSYWRNLHTVRAWGYA